MTDSAKQRKGKDVFATDADEFIRFLAEKTKIECPACGEKNWTVLCPPDNSDTYRFGLQIRNLEKRPYVSVFSAFCTSCGYMRAHNSRIVRQWLDDNPAAQIELDLGDGEAAQDDSDER